MPIKNKAKTLNIPDAFSYYSRGYSIPLEILKAIATVESNNDPNACRFERGYRWLWDLENNKPFRRISPQQAAVAGAPKDFPAPPTSLGYYSSADTEYTLQKSSHGLMQIMGAVLRERGYFGPLTEIYQYPCIGIQFGAAHLSNLHRRFYKKHGWAGVVSAFNQGTPRTNDQGVYRNWQYLNKINVSGAKRFISHVNPTVIV